jgi:hypothetical protein
MKMKNRIFIVLSVFLVLNWNGPLFGQVQPEEKSVPGALLRSMVLPGWGEYYTENYTAAKWTFGAELAVWISYFYLDFQSGVLEEQFKDIAVAYAGVNSIDRGKQYWIDVGSSENIYLHNIKAARNRDKDGIYTDIEKYYWQWSDRGRQADYNHLRVRSVDYADYAKMTLGGLFLTRLVSGVLAVRGAKRYNRDLRESKKNSYGLYFSPELDSGREVYMAARLKICF